jgi:hypothetical protein
MPEPATHAAAAKATGMPTIHREILRMFSLTGFPSLGIRPRNDLNR